MSQQSIEEFLNLNPDEISHREQELRAKIPTIPGTAYLEARLQEFKVQPWPLVIYLAYNNQELLERGLRSYQDYDGAENVGVIKEKLRECCILGKLLYKLGGGRTIIDTQAEAVSKE